MRKTFTRIGVAWAVLFCAALVFVPGAHGQAATAAPPQAATAAPATAACSKVWLGHEADYEEYLRTAVIAKTSEIPIGVTKPKRVDFAEGGLVKSAAWKVLPPGRHSGFWDSYTSEIAAYEIDKLLGLGMTPPAVERRVSGDKGAAVQWVENVKGWDMKQPVTAPDVTAWSRQVVKMKMFDNFIGNIDRNQGNLLYDPDWHLILIDHSRAFVADKRLPFQMNYIDLPLWERMKAVTPEQLQTTLGPWIDKGQIKAILARRDEMQKAIDKLVAAKGQGAVFLR